MHLSKFTSILTLLTVQNPQISNELELLRSAIVRWHEGVEQQMVEKNRAIMAAKTRGNEKLLLLFKQIDNFFDNLLRNYSDPNLPLFYRMFLKIKEEFEFIDVDFGKFIPKSKEKQVQTDRQSVYIYGMDMEKFMKHYESKQNQLEEAKIKISEAEDRNQKLEDQIGRLVDQNRKDLEDYENKIRDLMQLLEKTKASHSQTEKRSYRSNPQIMYPQFLPSKRVIKNLLKDANYDDELAGQDQQKDQNLSIEKEGSDPEYLRFLYCQAVTLEGMLASLEAREKAEEYDGQQ